MLSIGEVTALTGVPAETLRRWERSYGLLQPIRTDGGQRRYSPEDVSRVEIVLDLARQGWSRGDAARTVAEQGHAPHPPLDTSLFDALPLGVVVADAAQRIVYVNQHIAAMLETDSESLVGRSGFDHLDDDGRHQALQIFERLRNGEHITSEMRVLSTSGREIILDYWTCPLFGPDGSFRGSIGLTRDRTSDHVAEAELRLHARLLSAVAEAVIATDLHCRVLYWNRAAERQFGWRADEVIGRDVMALTPVGVVARMQGVREEAVARGECVREVQGKRRDGAAVVSRLTVSPLEEGGAVTGFITVCVDITDRRRAEGEARSRAAQQEVVAVIGQLALAGEPVRSVVRDAAVAIAGTLDATFVSVLGCPPGSTDLSVLFALPDSPASADQPTSPFASHAAYTLRSQRPVVVEDFELERRFRRGPLAGEESARSGVSVPIPALGGSAGVLCVYWMAPRIVSANDVSFLQSTANLIGFVLQRDRIESELQRVTAR